MVWCPHCAKNSETHRDYTTGSVCCVDCGKVVSQDIYSEDATFVKDAAGGAHLAGNLVRMESACAESHRRTLEKGNVIIYELIDKYGISNVSHATKYYQIAVERGFTRGRRTAQVAAACLYVACREKEKPFLLIEFSSELGVSVYELGTVYLQLCKLLSLQDHPFVQKPVDPSLFMHRYTSGLIKGDGNKKVLNTALHLAVSMKRDWIQTGRKPSGICAAAIYVSSVLHGYNFSRADVKSVHICEATLTKRLIEFENTKAGSLTVSCYLNNAEESRYKKIIWEQLNKEYMQEQAAKEAAAAAARKLYTGTSEEIREAQALAAAAAEAVASKREKEKRKRALEAKNAKPAQTAAEAAGQLFTKKKLSSKINYDMLNILFDDEVTVSDCVSLSADFLKQPRYLARRSWAGNMC